MKKNRVFIFAAFIFVTAGLTGCNFFKNLAEGKTPDVKGVWEITQLKSESFPKTEENIGTVQVFIYFSNDRKYYIAQKITGSTGGKLDGLFEHKDLKSGKYEVNVLGIKTTMTGGAPVPCISENGVLKISVAGTVFLEAKKVDSPSGDDIKNAKPIGA